MPARQTPQSSTTNTAADSYTNDVGRRSSRRIASRAPAPASTPAPTPAAARSTPAAKRTTPAPAAKRAAPAPTAKRAAPASRSRAPASRNRGPATRAAPVNFGKRKRGANDGDEDEETPAKKRRATAPNTKDEPKKRKRGAADDDEEEKEGEEEEQRPQKRRAAKGGEQQEEKDEASKKRKRALDDEEEDGEEDAEKECPKKQKTGGKNQRKASAAGKADTAKETATTTKIAATKKASATKKTTMTKKTAATKKASGKSTKTNTNTNTKTPTSRLGQRAPETRDDGEGPSSTPSSVPAQDHTPPPAQSHIQQPIASIPRPKSPPRRLTSIPPPEAWGPDRTASRPKHPYTTPPPVPRGKYAPAYPSHTPEGLPICFPQPFNDRIPDTIPEQTYEATLPFPGAADFGYAPLGQRTHDRGLQRQRATFLPPPPPERTGSSAPPPQPPVLRQAPHPPPCRNILIPTPRLPSQPGPGWLIDPTGLRARSPRGSHYRWHERRLHDYIPDWNVMPLWSAYQRQKHANYKLFVQGRLTFFKHRPVDESEEEVRYGEYVPFTRQPLRRHEQLVQFGWVKLDGEEAMEAECWWEQWRPRPEQPVASTSRLPEASTSELPEASSSRLPEPRVADAEIEKCDTDIEEEVEREVTYVGKGKGRAL